MLAVPGIFVLCTVVAAVAAAAAWALGQQVPAQVLAGLVAVLLVYVLALALLRADRLVSDGTDAARDASLRTVVLRGYAHTATVANRTWTTVDPDASNYAPLTRSINRRGGAQFSYSFWLYIGNTSPASVANKTILLHGDPKLVSWRRMKADGTLLNDMANQVLTKCPLIRFGPTYDSLVVEFNTAQDPHSLLEVKPNPSRDDPSKRANLLKLGLNKWALHTVVFEDHVAINDFENGLAVRYYFNDTLYSTLHLPTTLVQNNGDLLLLPGASSLPDCKIGDVTYHNVALSPDRVRQLYLGGPPRRPAKELVEARGEPLVLSEFNRIDRYNTSSMR